MSSSIVCVLTRSNLAKITMPRLHQTNGSVMPLNRTWRANVILSHGNLNSRGVAISIRKKGTDWTIHSQNYRPPRTIYHSQS